MTAAEPVTLAQLAKSARTIAAAKTKRADLIRELSAEGASLATIGAAAGLSKAGVAKILRSDPKETN